MASVHYTKQFGRWAEAAVARAFRDRKYSVETHTLENWHALRDIQVEKEGKEISIQVKATGKQNNIGDVYRISFGHLKNYKTLSEQLKKRWCLAVANPVKGAIYLYMDDFLNPLVDQEEKRIGDHYSLPGLIDLEYSDALRVWSLSLSEINDGIQIMEMKKNPDQKNNSDLISA